jgi:cephalosporin-C deacetylase-like acetyl esterase
VPAVPLNPRSRFIKGTDRWIAHEVILDVWKDVFAWGYLLLPKDLKAGERRPVVVCQHGLEGLPEDVINPDPSSAAWPSYKAFAAQLADRGFVVFAPHNPYRGGDAFRGLQRKLNPLGRTLFSVIVPQHERMLDWLTTQPFVDPARIGFYGLSYGGKSAMRIPALEDRYVLSICSADFNEWVRKNVRVDSVESYLYTGEYEIFEWDLGHTFNYAEMAALIAPRPFMVERGHKDNVAPDEWVAYEYSKVRRLYAQLGIPERTAIEFFDGPHTINGQGTFEFLQRHLRWPE